MIDSNAVHMIDGPMPWFLSTGCCMKIWHTAVPLRQQLQPDPLVSCIMAYTPPPHTSCCVNTRTSNAINTHTRHWSYVPKPLSLCSSLMYYYVCTVCIHRSLYSCSSIILRNLYFGADPSALFHPFQSLLLLFCCCCAGKKKSLPLQPVRVLT